MVLNILQNKVFKSFVWISTQIQHRSSEKTKFSGWELLKFPLKWILEEKDLFQLQMYRRVSAIPDKV